MLDPRRLELLLELSRLGSMRAVADTLRVTTSTVSQQIAVLSREAGTALVEPDGRRVRLTPAGRRLADHAVTVLAALEAARLDIEPDAEPRGTVRVAAFATAVRHSLMPVIRDLAAEGSSIALMVSEQEPREAFGQVSAGEADLALVYDYDLAPARFGTDLVVDKLWEAPWHLGVPDGRAPVDTESAAVLRQFATEDWIVNSRNTADEEVLRVLGALAGVGVRVTHRADSLELVQDLIGAGLGVGLLPEAMALEPGVTLVPLRDPPVSLRCFCVVRRGREAWPPVAAVRDALLAVPVSAPGQDNADLPGRSIGQYSGPPRGSRSGSRATNPWRE